MEFTKKVDPPQSNNNRALFDKLVATGKEVMVFQGYKYVLSNAKTLVPQCGIIAKLKDFHPFNDKTHISGNVNMNRFHAYAEAMYYLHEHNDPVATKKNAKKAEKDAVELEKLRAELAKFKKAKGKKPAKTPDEDSE